jgi:hypothetical protein
LRTPIEFVLGFVEPGSELLDSEFASGLEFSGRERGVSGRTEVFNSNFV